MIPLMRNLTIEVMSASSCFAKASSPGSFGSPKGCEEDRTEVLRAAHRRLSLLLFAAKKICPHDEDGPNHVNTWSANLSHVVRKDALLDVKDGIGFQILCRKVHSM